MTLPPPSSCPTFVVAHGLAMAYHYMLGAGDASVRTAAILDSAPCPKLDEHFTAIGHITRLRARMDDFGNTLRDQGFGARKLTPLPLFLPITCWGCHFNNFGIRVPSVDRYISRGLVFKNFFPN
jgi:hypothetical protein